MHNKRYADKVARTVPSERLMSSVALFETLQKFVPDEYAEEMATKLTRSFFDEFLHLTQYNVQITNRLKWIRRNSEYSFVPNFKEILKTIDDAKYLEGINTPTMLDLLDMLKMKIGMSESMTDSKKRSVINAVNLLVYRITSHLPTEGQTQPVTMRYEQALEAYKEVVQTSEIAEKYKTSTINAINLLLYRLKFLK